MDEKTDGISIIVCYRDPKRCEKLRSSVAATVGVEFEFIAFDNRVEKWGLCKVYNYCAKKAAYPYLCFVHEDVVITTNNWGGALIEFCRSTPDCGVVGVAGGTAVLKNFMAWNDGWPDNEVRYRLWDPNGKICPDGTLEFRNYNPDNADFKEVVTLDGCFLFVAQDIYAEKPFDEDIFTGFHFYDADFTFGIALTKKNYVYYKIDIHHYSSGTQNKDFCQSVRKFQIKWKDALPFTVGNGRARVWRELSIASEYIGKCWRTGAFGKIESVSHTVKLNGYVFFGKMVFCLCIRKILRILIMLRILKKRET